MTCNDYAQHVGIGAAVSGNGFSSAVDGLANRTAVFCGREPPQDLYAQVDRLCHQCNDLAHDLAAVREEIACLSQGNLPHPTTTHNEACQLEKARLASMGMPMSEGQPQAGPSCVTPATRSSMGRVQAEPAAAAPPTTTSTSSRKGKECQTSPAPTRTVLLYEDNQMDNLVQGPNAFDLVQGTLFPELSGQEPQVVILGDDSDAKGVHTLFAHMGNYIYAYQGEAISNAIISYNNGHVLLTPTRRLLNVTIHFERGIMGPVHLYNSAEEICAIFKAAHLKKEGRAPSYHQASDLITFLHLWRKHKSLEVSDLMKVTMKQWRLPIWASEKAKKKKEHLCDEKQRAIAAETVVPPPPVIIQALQEHITSQPMSPSGNSNSTPGNDSPANLLARIDEQPAPPLPKAEESSSHSRGPIVLNLKAHVLPHGAPSFDDPIDKWINFIEKCQAVCPLNSHGGLCKMFLGTVGCNIYPDNEDSDLNPPSRRQV